MNEWIDEWMNEWIYLLTCLKGICYVMLTSQSAGVATFFVAVNCNESITRKSSLEEKKITNKNKL